nr:MAG TPA: hypothetical protein [Caudoviricetes sp.]
MVLLHVYVKVATLWFLPAFRHRRGAKHHTMRSPYMRCCTP